MNDLERTLARIVANDATLTRVDFSGRGIGDKGARMIFVRAVMALEHNTVVIALNLRDNGLRARFVELLVERVLKNRTTALQDLVLSENDLGDEGARVLAGFLRSGTPLVKLFLDNCCIGGAGAIALAEALPSNSTLIELRLGNSYEHDFGKNTIGDAGASALAGPLRGDNSTLVKLDLSRNGISDVGLTSLADALLDNASLTLLNLAENNMTAVGARLIVKAVLVNCTVINLGLFGGDIDCDFMELMDELAVINRDASSPREVLGFKIELLRKLSKDDLDLLGFEESFVEEAIRRLETAGRSMASSEESDDESDRSEEDDDLSSSDSDDYQAPEIDLDRTCERIAANDATLTKLNFRGLRIGDEGAAKVVVALRTNTVVLFINLRRNNLSAATVTALVGVLEYSRTLLNLRLGGNRFGVEGLRALTRLLRHTSSLSILTLHYCGISVEGVRVLAGVLPRNSTLKILDLGHNNIGDEGASVLARVFPELPFDIKLYLDRNGISDVGATSLAEILPHTSSLTVLGLNNNAISDVGVRLFAKALLVNSSVIDLFLHDTDTSQELDQLVDDLAEINCEEYDPEEAHRLKVVRKVGWLIDPRVEGGKEEAVTLVLDELEHFMRADQRRGLFEQLLGSPEHGAAVAESADDATARTLYLYAAQCGAAPGVLMNLLRAHAPLCTCRDVKHWLYPFMLLATMAEAGVGDVMEALQKDPTLVESGIDARGDGSTERA